MLIALGSFAFWKAIEFANTAHGSHTVRAIFAALTAAVLILHGEFYILWPDWKLIQNPLAFSFHGPGKASWNLPNAVLVSSNASDIDGTYTVGNQKLSFDTLDESRSCPIILDREGNTDRETPLLRSGPDDGPRVSRLDEKPSMRKGGVDRFVRTDERALPTSNENANDGGVSDNESSEDRDDNAGFFPTVMIFAFGVISLGGGYALSIFLLTGDKKPPWKVVAAVSSLVAGIWLIGHGTNMAMDAYKASRHYHYSENYLGLRSSRASRAIQIQRSPYPRQAATRPFTSPGTPRTRQTLSWTASCRTASSRTRTSI